MPLHIELFFLIIIEQLNLSDQYGSKQKNNLNEALPKPTYEC